MDLKDFVEMSKYAGMREDLVQAGGGNSSLKISEDKMVIKASGYQLSEVTEQDGYAIVNPKVIRDAFLHYENLDNMTDEESKEILSKALIEGRRPSIETFLHSISGRFSLHTHPIVVSILATRQNGDKILKELFPTALIVPYATPGVGLAKEYFKEYKEYRKIHENDPIYVFLMNHGFLTSAETKEDVVRLTEEVTLKIEQYLGLDYSEYHVMNSLLSLYPSGILWRVTDAHVLSALKRFGGIWDHCFCPDCAVFLGKRMYTVNSTDKSSFEAFVRNNGYPVILKYKDYLYIHSTSVKKAMEIQSVLSFSAQVAEKNIGSEVNHLSEKEINYLLNWDAEKYRQNIR